MQQYDELFEARGSSYDSAMRRFPDARAAEFAQVVQAAALRSGMLVGDVPAGGGYLQQYLPDGTHYLAHEPCTTFAPDQQGHATLRPLLPLPWPESLLDVVISLAGTHHVDDKLSLFRDMHRVTRAGGRLVISDVAESSPVASFLDDFVGQHNSTGHEGSYLNADTLRLLRLAGWQVVSDCLHQILWHFANDEQLATFCGLLFDIRDASPDQIIDAVRTRLGVRQGPQGVELCWSLRTIIALKTADQT